MTTEHTTRTTTTTGIQEFLDTWARAERNTDADTMAPLLTDDFTGIGPVGFQLDKPAWLARLTGGDLTYDELFLDEVTLRGYGSSALVTARWNATGTARGMPLPNARATLALIRSGSSDRWLLAGIHYSFIGGPPGAPGAA